MIKHFVNSGILGAFALVSSAALVACGANGIKYGATYNRLAYAKRKPKCLTKNIKMRYPSGLPRDFAVHFCSDIVF